MAKFIKFCVKLNASWTARHTLFNSISRSTLLYCVSVWGLRYTNLLEQAQVNFYKHLFNLSKHTPNYLIRIELNLKSISIFIIKLTVKYLIKILKMEQHRYPRLCYNRLFILDSTPNNKAKYNWVSQVGNIFESLDYFDLWLRQSPNEIEKELPNILKKFDN